MFLAAPLFGNSQTYILIAAFNKDLTLEDKQKNIFFAFHERIEEKFTTKQIDDSRLGWSLTKALSDFVEEHNHSILGITQEEDD